MRKIKVLFMKISERLEQYWYLVYVLYPVLFEEALWVCGSRSGNEKIRKFKIGCPEYPFLSKFSPFFRTVNCCNFGFKS